MGENKVGRPAGTKLSDESKRKISDSKRGTHHTDETKEAIRQGVSKYWARVRASKTQDRVPKTTTPSKEED